VALHHAGKLPYGYFHCEPPLCSQSFALPFSHMHAKVKHGWWSDLHRALIHCLGCGHFMLLPAIVLACHVW